jgi:hypothetical protein
MFETAVHDSPQNFRLEKEVSEAGAVDRDVRTLHLFLGSAVGDSSCLDGNLGLKKEGFGYFLFGGTPLFSSIKLQMVVIN